MEKNTYKKVVNAITFLIFGLIIAIVVVRIILKLVGANVENEFVIFWYELSNFFTSIFNNMFQSFEIPGTDYIIETSSGAAILFYIIIGGLFNKFLSIFDIFNPRDVLRNLVDFSFKILEFILLARFFFKLTGASTDSSFVNGMYKLTDFIINPLNDILPTFEIAQINVIFELSTILIVIIIIIFDIVSEGFIKRILGPQPKEVEVDQTGGNITINIPQQPVATTGQTYASNTTPQTNPTTISVNNPQVANNQPNRPQTISVQQQNPANYQPQAGQPTRST